MRPMDNAEHGVVSIMAWTATDVPFLAFRILSCQHVNKFRRKNYKQANRRFGTILVTPPLTSIVP